MAIKANTTLAQGAIRQFDALVLGMPQAPGLIEPGKRIRQLTIRRQLGNHRCDIASKCTLLRLVGGISIGIGEGESTSVGLLIGQF